MTMLVMLTDRGHILLQKKEDILSVLSNPSLEKRGICTLPLVMSFGISKEPILMIPRAHYDQKDKNKPQKVHFWLKLGPNPQPI